MSSMRVVGGKTPRGHGSDAVAPRRRGSRTRTIARRTVREDGRYWQAVLVELQVQVSSGKTGGQFAVFG
jgi:hypothetical protein